MNKIKWRNEMMGTKMLIGCFVASLTLVTSGFAQNKVKVACLGDSITFGARVENRKSNSYPAQLGKILGDGYEVGNFGKSGITMSRYMSTTQFDKAKAFAPDIVIVMLGTNDTKKRKLEISENKKEFAIAYTKSCKELIKELRALKSKPKIFLCYPVPVFKTMGAIREQVLKEDIIPLISKISKDEDIPTIDLYKALKGKGKMVPDGVHPNKDGQKVIANSVAMEIKRNKKAR